MPHAAVAAPLATTRTLDSHCAGRLGVPLRGGVVSAASLGATSWHCCRRCPVALESSLAGAVVPVAGASISTAEPGCYASGRR